jgi:hypothetical protein
MGRFLLIAITLAGCARDKPEPLYMPMRRQPPSAVAPATPRVSSPILTSLAEVERFALGGIGPAGTTSQGERLARALAREPDAHAKFVELAAGPNPVARLYAYWAFRSLDPARAEALRAELVLDTTPLESQQGCMVMPATAAQILDDIDRIPLQIAP